jgi:hypothetical protein
MWAPVGKQPEIPAPGQNKKKVVYGGVDYATGKITYTVADSKSGTNFLIFLVALVKSYAGCKIRLVCDNGRFHHTRAIQEWLKVGPICEFGPVLISEIEPFASARWRVRGQAHTPTDLGTRRTARSVVRLQLWRVRAWRGRAGQAFELGESGVANGSTANPSPQTAAGRYRMTRSSRRSPPRGTACGFWIRAWGQHEPALRGTGRLNDPARCQFAQGWAGHPFHSRLMKLTSHGTPDPVVAAPRLVTRWSDRSLCLSYDSSLLE